MDNTEALEIADELDAMAERITRYSNNTGDGLCTRAAQLLRALSRSQDVARVAEGWKLVPLKVTNEMIDTYSVTPSGIAGSPPHLQWVWDAVLSAAPQINPAE
jgi:hypothetical protein